MGSRDVAEDGNAQVGTAIRGRVLQPGDADYVRFDRRSTSEHDTGAKRNAESARRRAPVALASAMAVGLVITAGVGLAFRWAAIGGPGSAVGAVGIVLAEAIALYVCAEVLVRAVYPALRDPLASD